MAGQLEDWNMYIGPRFSPRSLPAASIRIRFAIFGAALLSIAMLGLAAFTLLLPPAEAQGIRLDDIEVVVTPAKLILLEDPGAQASFKFTLHSTTRQTATITAKMIDGTAELNKDYRSLEISGGTLNRNGEFKVKKNQTVNILAGIRKDRLKEGDETFEVEFKIKESGVTFGGGINDPNSLIYKVTILDREPSTVSFGNFQYRADEGDDLAFEVNLEGNGKGTVDYKVSDSSTAEPITALGGGVVRGDYTTADGLSGTLEFDGRKADGKSHTITFNTITDSLIEKNDTIVLRLSNATGDLSIAGSRSSTGVIIHNDGELWADVPDVTVTEGRDAQLTVNLERALKREETVAFFAAVQGSQPNLVSECQSGQKDFAQKNVDYQTFEYVEYVMLEGDRSITIPLPTSPDDLHEDNECFYAALLVSNGMKFRAQSGQTNRVNSHLILPRITIIDDDLMPELRYGHPEVAEPDPVWRENNVDTATLRFPVSLTSPSSRTVTVDYVEGSGGIDPTLRATSGEDYTPIQPGTLTFMPGEVQKYVEVEIKGDFIKEPDEWVYVKFSNAVNACLLPRCGPGSAISVPGTILNDDQNLTITIEPDDDRVREGDDIVFRAKLSNPIPYPLNLSAVGGFGGTATRGADYLDTAVFGVTLGIEPGQTEGTTIVSTIADGVSGEGVETVILKVETAKLGGEHVHNLYGQKIFGELLFPETVAARIPASTAYILDGPVISVTAARESVGEGNSLDFHVALSEPAAQDVTFTVKSVDGAEGAEGAAVAAAVKDYTALAPQQVTIPVGQTDGGTFSIATHQDQVDEPNHQFTVLLEDVNGVTVDEGAAVGIIRDDDPRPILSITDDEANEGDELSFLVTMTGATERTVTVHWVTEDDTATHGLDYREVERLQVVTFAPGVKEQAIAVQSLPDNEPEEQETFRVQLTDAYGARVEDATAVGYITDDDGSIISIADAPTVTETAGDTAQATFTITMTPAQTTPVTIHWETMDGTGGDDYVAMSGGLSVDGEKDYTAVGRTAVTFAPGETMKQVSTTILDDSTAEMDETFRAVITKSNSNITLLRSTAYATIEDDDAYSIWIDDSTPTYVVEGDVNQRVTVKLKRTDASAIESQQDPRFHTHFTYIGCFITELVDHWPLIAIPNVEDYASTASVPGDVAYGTNRSPVCHWRDDGADFTLEMFKKEQYELSFDLTIMGDNRPEENETFTFLLESTAFNHYSRWFLDPESRNFKYITMTIVDDDTPQASISDVSVDESAGSAELTLSLSQPSSTHQTVLVSMEDGTALAWQDYRPQFKHKVEFPAGVTEAKISVPIIDDEEEEGTETFTVMLSDPSDGLNIHPAGVVATVTITETDTDSRPRLIIRDQVVNEGDDVTLHFEFDPPVPDDALWESNLYVFPENTWPLAEATGGVDYTSIKDSIELEVSPGDTDLTATISTTEDTIVEEDEYIGISIEWHNSDELEPRFDGRKRGQPGGKLTLISIRDDDSHSVSLSPIADSTVAENSDWTATPELTAASDAAGGVTWSVEGDDAALFTIDPDKGALALPAQDFEDPADQDGDNVYKTTVQVVDEDGNTATQGVQVAVTDINYVEIDVSISRCCHSDPNQRPYGAVEGEDIQVTVQPTFIQTTPVSVKWATAEDTKGTNRANATDYTPSETPTAITWPEGTAGTTGAAQSFTISTTEDEQFEAAETFLLSFTEGMTGTTGEVTFNFQGADASAVRLKGNAAEAVIAIGDDDYPTLSIADAKAVEKDVVRFTVNLSDTPLEDVTFKWSTADDTAAANATPPTGATAGTDYTAVTIAQTVTIPAGQRMATVEVQTTDDAVEEHDETFLVELSDPVGAVLSAGESTATGIIQDNDGNNNKPRVSISSGSAWVEGGWVEFTIHLSEPLPETVQIPIDLEFVTADDYDCWEYNDTERCGPDLVPHKSMLGPEYAGIQDHSDILPPHPKKPWLVEVPAGETSGSGSIGVRKDDDGENERFRIVIDTTAAEWPVLKVKEGETTFVEVVIVDDATYAIASGWWAGLSQQARERMVGDAASGTYWEHLLSQSVSKPFAKMRPENRAQAGALAGELVDAERSGAEKLRDLSTPENWWDDLDCRQRRIAVGEGVTEDKKSPWCRDWPDGGWARLADPLKFTAIDIFEAISIGTGAVGNVNDPSPQQSEPLVMPTTSVSNVQVAAVDAASASVSWDAVPHATSYEVSWDGVGSQSANTGVVPGVTGTSATIQHNAPEAMTLTVTVTPEYVDGNGQTQALTNLAGTATLAVGSGDTPAAEQACESQLPADAITVAEVTGWRDALDATKAAAGIKRWNRVLEAFGVDTGAGVSAMTAAQAQAVADWLKNTRWDRTARTLEALEQCAGSTSDDSQQTTPEISISAGGGVTEGSNATFTVSASPAPAADLTVSVSVTQSGDYGATTGAQTVTIPTSGSYTLTVATSDDSADEADGSVTATVNTGTGYTVASSNGAATVAVADNDVPEISIASTGDVTEGSNASFTVTASPTPHAALSVSVTVSQSGDYGATTGAQTVSIPTSGSYTLTVATSGDSADEADGSVTATVNGGTGYTVSSSNGAATVAVSDDDDPPAEQTCNLPDDAVTADEVTGWRDALDPNRAAAGVKRWNRVLEAFGVDTGAGVTPMTATQARGVANWLKNTRWDRTARTLEALDQCQNSPAPTPTPAPAATPEISIASAGDVTEGSDASFTISANPTPSAALSVSVTVLQSGDYGATTGAQTVTIPTSGSYTLTVSTTNDSADEADGSVTATLNTGTGYTVSTSNGAATVAVSDDDVPEISIASAGDVTEGSDASFTISANPTPSAALSVSVTVSQSGDYGATTGAQTVTIPTSGSYTLTVSTTNDSADEADGSVTATLNTGTGYTVSTSNGAATVVVSDDDDLPPQQTEQTCNLPADAITVSEVTGWRDEHNAATHQSRWNRVLEALGEDTGSGETSMTAAQARDIKSQINNSRWDRTARTLEALEQCAGSTDADSQQTTPEISIAAGGGVTEGSDASFTITANPTPSAALSVSVTVSQSGDFGVTTGARTVSIPTGGSYTLTVATSGDSADEADGSVTATLNTGTGYTVSSSNGAATVAVSDDDVPEISIASDGDVTEGSNASFTSPPARRLTPLCP